MSEENKGINMHDITRGRHIKVSDTVDLPPNVIDIVRQNEELRHALKEMLWLIGEGARSLEDYDGIAERIIDQANAALICPQDKL